MISYSRYNALRAKRGLLVLNIKDGKKNDTSPKTLKINYQRSVEKLLEVRMKPRNYLCLLLRDVWVGVKPGINLLS